MAVGVVADNVAIVESQHALHVECRLEPLFYLLPRQGLVAVGGQEAGGGGEERAFSVALYAASLQHEIGLVVLGVEQSRLEEPGGDGVVGLPGKLLAPSVESEVADHIRGSNERDGAVVARPRVVCSTMDDANVGKGPWRKGGLQLGDGLPTVGSDHDEPLMRGHRLGQLLEGEPRLVQVGPPVGALVRPGQLQAALGMPFRGQKDIGVLRIHCRCVV